MLRRNKILLISGATMIATSAIVAGTVIGLSQNARNNESSLVDGPVSGIVQTPNNPHQPSVSYSKSGIKITKVETVKTMSSEGVSQEEYLLKFELGEDITKYGNLHFEKDGKLSTEIKVVAGEKVHVKMSLNEPEKYTLLDLLVFDKANKNISLGVEKVEENHYTFTMPEKDSEFYQTGQIGIEAIFGLKKQNAWEYDFNRRKYVINVTEDNFVLDDTLPDMSLVAGSAENPIRYMIVLNGHDIKIKNLSIPSGAELLFINNDGKAPSGDQKIPLVSTTKDAKISIDVKGIVGRYRDVNFTKEVHYIFTGNPNLASQLPEDEKNKVWDERY